MWLRPGGINRGAVQMLASDAAVLQSKLKLGGVQTVSSDGVPPW